MKPLCLFLAFSLLLSFSGCGQEMGQVKTSPTAEDDENSYGTPPERESGKRLAYRLEDDIKAGRLAEKTDLALSAMVKVGASELERKGYHEEALQLTSEWEGTYRGFLLRPLEAVGDHDPIHWLEKTWSLLDSFLGRKVMIFTHLDDIWVFAYTIKVVFKCEDHVDKDEYARHFTGVSRHTGFAPSLAYWVVYIACAVGVPAPYSIACSPVATVGEIVTWKWIAPRVSPWAYGKICQ